MDELLFSHSKHSQYQELYHRLADRLGSYGPAGRRESKRWDYMVSCLEIRGKTVLDIGANTGFFSFAAVDSGAALVTAIEGNTEHAEFISKAARLMQIPDFLRVEKRYFLFDQTEHGRADVAFCLNVLHHLGDDFGDSDISLDLARRAIADRIRVLAFIAEHCWFQIGYNWKGDRRLPIFERGLKKEMIEFVADACAEYWEIEEVAIYSPASLRYERVREPLLARFDDLGEFLNRPLFLLRSLRNAG